MNEAVQERLLSRAERRAIARNTGTKWKDAIENQPKPLAVLAAKKRLEDEADWNRRVRDLNQYLKEKGIDAQAIAL